VYDTKTEATVRGTISAVETVTLAGDSGRRSLSGTHLTLKSGSETIQIHLGPSAYLADQKINLEEGDVVEIRGSRVTINDEQVLLAREVKKGNGTWRLRDASGRPLWRVGRRQTAGEPTGWRGDWSRPRRGMAGLHCRGRCCRRTAV
jgi:hypothetical protein